MAQGSPTKPNITAQTRMDEAQKKAQDLFDRERRVSDIRSPNSPAFRLNATFTYVGSNLRQSHGTYAEDWVSNTRWRRETVAEDHRRVEVGGPAEWWQLDEPADFPERAQSIADIMDELPSNLSQLRFEDVSEVRDLENNVSLVCAQSISGGLGETYRFCFDGGTGVLLRKTIPVTRLRNLIEYTCSYGMFKKFGDHLFPAQIQCSQDTHLDINISIEKLVADPSPNPSLFVAPAGAKQLPNCPTEIKPPKQIPSDEIALATGRSGDVIVNFTVGVDGRPRDLGVVSSTNSRLNKQALNSVRHWRFSPATCNNQPIPFPLDIKVSFGQ